MHPYCQMMHECDVISFLPYIFCHAVLGRHVGLGRWVRTSSEGTLCNSCLCKNCLLHILLLILFPRDYINSLSHCLYVTTSNLKNGFVLPMVQGAQSITVTRRTGGWPHCAQVRKQRGINACLSSFLPWIHARTLTYGMAPPTYRVGLPTSIIYYR